MLNAFPLRPDQELLPEALRAVAPRPVRYVPWVKNTRALMLNGGIAAMLLAQWLVPQTERATLLAIALSSASAILVLECHFRYRFYLLSRGEATIGVVVSREIIKSKGGESFQVRYCYWTRTGKTRYDAFPASKQDYEGYPAGNPITILYNSEFWIDSLPLFLIGEAELV